jgi:biopolymer transport protein ExbD
MRRSSFDRPARVEMLPLIDVLFLLLAVFIYSMLAMVRAHVVPVELPQLATGENRDLSVVLTISIEENGALAVGGEEVELDVLEERLRERRAGEPELSVVINADREARHGVVTEVFDRVRAAGQERVLIVGRPTRAATAE